MTTEGGILRGVGGLLSRDGGPEERKERSMGGRRGGGDREASATMRGPMVGGGDRSGRGGKGPFLLSPKYPPPRKTLPCLPRPLPNPRRTRDH